MTSDPEAQKNLLPVVKPSGTLCPNELRKAAMDLRRSPHQRGATPPELPQHHQRSPSAGLPHSAAEAQQSAPGAAHLQLRPARKRSTLMMRMMSESKRKGPSAAAPDKILTRLPDLVGTAT